MTICMDCKRERCSCRGDGSRIIDDLALSQTIFERDKAAKARDRFEEDNKRLREALEMVRSECIRKLKASNFHMCVKHILVQVSQALDGTKESERVRELERRLAEEIKYGHAQCTMDNCASSGVDCPAHTPRAESPDEQTQRYYRAMNKADERSRRLQAQIDEMVNAEVTDVTQ